MEASRKHGPFDTRWPCVRNDSASVVPDVSLAGPSRLSLVRTEPASAGAEAERDELGTRRLLAAVLAVEPAGTDRTMP